MQKPYVPNVSPHLSIRDLLTLTLRFSFFKISWYTESNRKRKGEKSMFTTHPAIPERILYAFPYGSKVYGTNTEKSDDDFIVVIEGNDEHERGIHEGDVNITVYSEVTFQRLLNEHDIAALECYFSNETHFDWTLDLPQLRRSISAVASNSFVKCKKKLMPGPDYNPYVAKKSLFHSMRILDFGIQIATHGRIVDFAKSNDLFVEIMSIDSDDWNVYKERFQKRANALKSAFKVVAPLDKDSRNKKW